MTTPYTDGNGPLIPMPELTLPALRQAVATVAPSRLPEFFDDLQKAFVRAGDEDSVVPIRMFYRQWGVVVEIERHPDTAHRLHAAEQALSSPTRTCASAPPRGRRDRTSRTPRGRRWLTHGTGAGQP